MDSGKAETLEEGVNVIRGKLKDGSAALKFIEMMVAQGVDPAVARSLVEDDGKIRTKLPASKHTTDITALSGGKPPIITVKHYHTKKTCICKQGIPMAFLKL